MDENETKLNELGVNILSQSSLEEKIENNATILINKQLIDNETNRLDRAQNALHLALKKKAVLERKINNASRISVRNLLQEQLQKLITTELAECKKNIKEIKERLDDLESQNSNKNSSARQRSDRLDGESEKDYLIRTGQLTAFGSKTGFTIDEEHVDGDNYEMANEQMIENLTDESEVDMTIDNNIKEEFDDVVEIETSSTSDDSSYLEEELNDFTTENESKSFKYTSGVVEDDGDELYYQKRLRQWIKQRSKNRTNDNNDVQEWHKPHPDIPDAKLNDEFKIPGDIFSLLFNYQKTCVQWLYELNKQGCGGILGDEMGLGKTIQIIAYLAALHHSSLLDGPVLIVCPATVMKQWCSELHHWWPPLRSVILHQIGSGISKQNKHKNLSEEQLEDIIMNSNPDEFSYDDLKINPGKTKAQISHTSIVQGLIDKVTNDGHVLITTYVGLKVHSDKLLNVRWSNVILDEGHKIRNPNSEIALTCKKLKSPNRIILSGTPIQNNLNELWSLFDFIYPGKLGTLPVFQQQFVIPINLGGYANATNVQVQAGYKCATALRDMISPYLLRRVKADVAKDLPHKKEMVLFCKLTVFQRQKYLEFLNSKELEQIQKGKRQVLYGIDILRKICNHPDLLDRENKKWDKNYGAPKRSGKMQVVKQLLTLWQSQGHKTLLFSQTKQMLEILENFISFQDPEMSSIKFLKMDGSTNISVRQSLVDKFNNEDYDLFLLTTRVGGLGINLTGANRIIIFDPDWNPSTDMQARERAWRIGQKREVSIYRLMVTGTIEEKIYHRQIFKQFLTNKILNDPKQKRFFKMNELHDLFSLGGENGHATEELEQEVQKHTQSLKNSVSKESDDFEQVVGLNGVSKLESFYNGKEQKEKIETDDDRIMEGLLGEGAIDAIKSQKAIEDSHSKASTKSIELEAAKIAEQALEALKKSRKITKKYDIGTPTWTGKFGQAGKIKKTKTGSRKTGSASIIANIRKTQQDSTSIVKPEDDTRILTKNEATLLKIKDFLSTQNDNFATSANIINNIGVSLTDQTEVIKVRALLRSIAKFDKIKKGWILNSDL